MTPPRSLLRETGMRAALWLLLGGWVGAWLLFSFGVAVVSFRVLPTDQAGRVVGPLLDALHWYGVAAGVVLALLAVARRRGPVALGLPLVLSALCLASQLAVTPAIAALRDQAFGPGASLAAAERFAQLHRLSMGLFTAVGLGAIALAVLHARADAAEARGQSPSPSPNPR